MRNGILAKITLEITFLQTEVGRQIQVTCRKRCFDAFDAQMQTLEICGPFVTI